MSFILEIVIQGKRFYLKVKLYKKYYFIFKITYKMILSTLEGTKTKKQRSLRRPRYNVGIPNLLILLNFIEAPKIQGKINIACQTI